jgi:hypothetical protein
MGLAYLTNLWTRLHTAQPSVQAVLCQRFEHALTQIEARFPSPAEHTGSASGIVLHAPQSASGALPELNHAPIKAFSSVFARRRGGGAVRPGGGEGGVPTNVGGNALAALNAYIRQVSRPATPDPSGGAPELGALPSADTRPTAGAPAVSGGAPPAELKSARLFGETWSQLKTAQRVEEALRGAPENAGPFNPHLLVVKTLSTLKGLSPAYLHNFVLRADTLLQLEQVAAKLSSPAGKTKVARRRVPGQTSGTVS